MSNLGGKVALITGAGRGIGKTIARALAQEGMRVAINDVDPARAEGASAALRAEGLQALPAPADVTRKAEVEVMFERVEEELGLICCATPPGSAASTWMPCSR